MGRRGGRLLHIPRSIREQGRKEGNGKQGWVFEWKGRCATGGSRGAVDEAGVQFAAFGDVVSPSACGVGGGCEEWVGAGGAAAAAAVNHV